MLVEFRVSNFRSLQDEQVLSLVAGNKRSADGRNTYDTGIKAVPRLLRSAVVFGPNAGGKSNLVRALQYMRAVVVESATRQPGQSYNVQPFRLDPKFESQSTRFEMTFILDGVRHQYGFAMTKQRITEEYLLVYKSFKPQKWFNRYLDPKGGDELFEFSPSLKGQKSLWESATRSDTLFLSMAVQLNSEQLAPVFAWFRDGLVVTNELTPLAPDFAINRLRDPVAKEQMCAFLAAADISITDIEVVSRKKPGQKFHIDFLTGKSEMRQEEVEQNELRFHHRTDNGRAVFGLDEESGGTRNLLFLMGPVLDILDKGLALVIDELDTSLHTLLVRRLVQLFHDPATNPAGAQLIFTTHDTSLLSADGLLCRDQIWFVEKNREQASNLYALVEFNPRNNEALERGYLTGRYGGLPFLQEWSRTN